MLRVVEVQNVGILCEYPLTFLSMSNWFFPLYSRLPKKIDFYIGPSLATSTNVRNLSNSILPFSLCYCPSCHFLKERQWDKPLWLVKCPQPRGRGQWCLTCRAFINRTPFMNVNSLSQHMRSRGLSKFINLCCQSLWHHESCCFYDQLIALASMVKFDPCFKVY